MKPIRSCILNPGAVLLVCSLPIALHYGCELPPDVRAAASPSTIQTASNLINRDSIVKKVNKESKPIAASILSMPQVPILCYHQVREWRTTDSKTARDYIVPPAAFAAQMKALADSGYQTIIPDQLFDYLVNGTPLPSRPVMLSFDDSDLEQFTVALPEMKKYGYKGVFFIMTVSLGRPNYMTREQVKELSADGHTIGSHTWDHQNVKKYQGSDWQKQIEKPSAQLASITGKPVEYFAYPFGLWNKEAIPELKKRGMLAAFQLSDKRDPEDPMHTIRRMIVPGSWSGQAMIKRMKQSFK